MKKLLLIISLGICLGGNAVWANTQAENQIIELLRAINSGGGGGGGGAVTQSGTWTVISAPTQGAPTNRSGTITTGGTSQTLAAALSTRTYIEIQNISDETMYINFGAAATIDSNSFKLVAGASYVNAPQYCPTGTITIIGATTGKKFVAKEG